MDGISLDQSTLSSHSHQPNKTSISLTMRAHKPGQYWSRTAMDRRWDYHSPYNIYSSRNMLESYIVITKKITSKPISHRLIMVFVRLLVTLIPQPSGPTDLPMLRSWGKILMLGSSHSTLTSSISKSSMSNLQRAEKTLWSRPKSLYNSQRPRQTNRKQRRLDHQLLCWPLSHRRVLLKFRVEVKVCPRQ